MANMAMTESGSYKYPPIQEVVCEIHLLPKNAVGEQVVKSMAKVLLADLPNQEFVPEKTLSIEITMGKAEAMEKVGRRPRLFVEVNTGGEAQKAGVAPEDADAFLARCRDAYGLTIEGLMCVPPVGEQASPHFALLNAIAARNGISRLSMGMSGDWPLAVQLGATHVRVGSAIYGSRV